MLSLEDPRWSELQGGYKIPYDASVALQAMEDGEDVWDELWEELHHQGDVGLASYAAVPQLVRIAGDWDERDWNFYGIVAMIEVERHRKGNPPMPAWLEADYKRAIAAASELALADLSGSADSDTTHAILSVLALAKGELKLGAMLSHLDASELDEWVEDQIGWSDFYEEQG